MGHRRLIRIARLVPVLMSTGWITGFMQAKSPNMKTAVQITNPHDIKGWMIGKDVMTTFAVDGKELIIRLKMPLNFDRNKTIKALATQYGFSDHDLRDIIVEMKQNKK